MSQIEIVPVVPFDDGIAAGKTTGADAVRAEIDTLLRDPLLKNRFGQMSRTELYREVTARRETTPDYVRYPELADLHPEALDTLRGSERLTGAILDRLTHRVHILEANGESYRLRESRKRQKRRPSTDQ